MAWMEMDYSKHTHLGWKIKWRLEHLGMLGIKTAALTSGFISDDLNPAAPVL